MARPPQTSERAQLKGLHSQILEISPGEFLVCNDLNLSFSLLANGYRISQVAHPSINLYLVV